MCTRVLWNTNDIAVLFGRTMDWPESTIRLRGGRPAAGGGARGVARSVTPMRVIPKIRREKQAEVHKGGDQHHDDEPFALPAAGARKAINHPTDWQTD